MSRTAVAAKWRPSLGLVVLAILVTIGALPLASLGFLRLYENQLVRQAEGELIGQSAVLAAALAQAVERYPDRASLLGPVVPDRRGSAVETALEPGLDLTRDAVLPERPEAQAAPLPRPGAVVVGLELFALIQRTRVVTLAGFRVLDPNGTVIAGGREFGRSLAHLEEIESARQGTFRAVLRARSPREAVPPLYSLSRGTRIRVFTAMPVVVDGRLAGIVYGSRTPNNLLRQVYAESGKVALGLAILMGAIVGVAFVFARVVTRPIHALVARAAAIGRGETAPDSPATHYGTREVALLGRSVDEMAHRLRERSDYIATFAAHVSHELKSPLTSIQGGAELMRDALDDADAPMPADAQRRFLDNMIADTARLSSMLGRLRELARADNPRTDGTTQIAAIAQNLRAAYPGLTVRVDGGASARLNLSPENAGIVFGHLADNALRHGAGHLTLSVRTTGERVVVTVENDGSAIPASLSERVFENFFTTRRDTGGTGMGLSIVQAMLAAHDGSIRLEPCTTGVRFTLALRRG